MQGDRSDLHTVAALDKSDLSDLPVRENTALLKTFLNPPSYIVAVFSDCFSFIKECIFTIFGTHYAALKE